LITNQPGKDNPLPTPHLHPRYVILPKDFEAGYKQVIRKGDTEFAFYQ
jgi:hypothetical protein